MKLIAPLLLSVMLGLTIHAWADDKQRLAEQAALEWLSQVDESDYQGSWQSAASLFKMQVSAEQWTQAASRTRKPLGSLISRELIKATYSTSLPGAPDGEYMVLQFRTAFANKLEAVETVTPTLDNGEWRVSGYFVR
jgi:hypothetical protein